MGSEHFLITFKKWHVIRFFNFLNLPIEIWLTLQKKSIYLQKLSMIYSNIKGFPSMNKVCGCFISEINCNWSSNSLCVTSWLHPHRLYGKFYVNKLTKRIYSAPLNLTQEGRKIEISWAIIVSRREVGGCSIQFAVRVVYGDESK